MRLVDGVAIQCAAQSGIDGKARGKRERRRLGQSGLGEIVQQAGVVFVDGGKRFLDVRQRGVENDLHNAPLFIGKQRGKRVVHVAVVAVDQAHCLGEVGALHVFGGLAGKSLKRGRILRLIRFDGRGDVLVAKVQHRKGEALLFAGNGADNFDPAQGQTSPPGGVCFVGVAPHTEAKQIGLLGKGRKDGADGVVSRHLFQV